MGKAQPEVRLIPAAQLTKNFLEGFAALYSSRDDFLVRQARASVISTVTTCLSICEPEDRKNIINGILLLADTISDTRFEDGQDFMAFLNEQGPKIKKDE